MPLNQCIQKLTGAMEAMCGLGLGCYMHWYNPGWVDDISLTSFLGGVSHRIISQNFPRNEFKKWTCLLKISQNLTTQWTNIKTCQSTGQLNSHCYNALQWSAGFEYQKKNYGHWPCCAERLMDQKYVYWTSV